MNYYGYALIKSNWNYQKYEYKVKTEDSDN